MVSPRVSPPSAVSASLAKDRLGAPSVISFAMTAAAPLLVVGALVVTGWAATGVTGLPLAFVLVGIVLAIFSAGYVAMARHVVNAGAFYSYIALGLHKTLGVGASFVAVLAYNLLQIGLYGIFGVVAQDLFTTKFHWHFHWWAYSLAAWLLVALLGALRVDINSKILGVLLAIEIVVVVIFDVVDLANPFKGSVSFSSFSPGNLFVTGLGAAFAIVVTGFVGFEAAPVFSEEARHARKTVPAATYSAIVVMGLVYAITAWSIAVAVGNSNVVSQAQQNGPDLIFNVAGKHLGNASVILDLGHALLLTSIFAAMLSYHNAVSRYSFALGREGVLPRILGHTRPRTGAPLMASIAQTITALIVILLFAINGWDPLGKLFFWLGTTGGVGILILLLVTSVAVIKFFANETRGESPWARIGAPVIAFIALAYMLYQTLNGYANLLGVKPDNPARWMLPSLYLVAAVIGILWALILRGTKPDVYNAIGLGATAGTAVAALSVANLTGPGQRTDTNPVDVRSVNDR
jgi:amino acid transporter